MVADGRSVLVTHATAFPAASSGRSRDGMPDALQGIAPADKTGLLSIFPTHISRDEESYVYTLVG